MMDGRIDFPEWKLERYVLEELPPDEMTAIREEAEWNEDLRRRIASLEASNREILVRHPPEDFAGRVRGRLQANGVRGGGRSGRGRTALALLPVAAGLALVVYPVLKDRGTGLPSPGSDAGDADVRVKGAPQLRIFRKTADGPEELSDGDRARPRDMVQMTYRPGHYGYGAILSLDGRGEVTVHLPATGEASVEMTPGKADTLGFAYELDDAPRWERFYLVTSDSPFALGPVLLAARGHAAQGESRLLALPRSLAQSMLELRKVGPDDE